MTQADKPNQLQVILKEQHVPKAQAQQLIEAFGGPFEEVGAILADYQTIKVTDVTDTVTMQKARTKRLALKKARTTVEGKRKELKEGIVKQGRAIDTVARFVKEVIAPAEDYLQLQEDFAKLEAQRQAEAKRAERLQKLSAFDVDPTIYNLDALTDEAFDELVARLQKDADDAKAAEAQAAKERADSEAAERAAQAKRDLEAKRLRSTSALGFYTNPEGNLMRHNYDAGIKTDDLMQLDDAAFDKQIDAFIKNSDEHNAKEAEARRADQLKIEAAAKKQTERINEITGYGARYDAELDGYVLDTLRVKITQIEKATDEDWANTVALFKKVADELVEADRKRDAELKTAREKEAADTQAKAEAEEAERKALLAPDKTKLLTLADGLEMVRTSKLPALKTKQAQDIVNDIDADITRIIANIRAKADRLK